MHMQQKDLRKWMDKNGKKAIDVAFLSHVSIRTVERFLAGDTREPHRTVMEAFQRMIDEIDRGKKGQS